MCLNINNKCIIHSNNTTDKIVVQLYETDIRNVNTCLFIYIEIGEAALYILREEFGENWAEKVKVIFAGDDTTDEDAMKVNLIFQLNV